MAKFVDGKLVRPAEEEDAIRAVLRLGKQFGYDNLARHLQTAFAKHLMDHNAADEKTARGIAGPGYPFEWTVPYME